MLHKIYLDAIYNRRLYAVPFQTGSHGCRLQCSQRLCAERRATCRERCRCRPAWASYALGRASPRCLTSLSCRAAYTMRAPACPARRTTWTRVARARPYYAPPGGSTRHPAVRRPNLPLQSQNLLCLEMNAGSLAWPGRSSRPVSAIAFRWRLVSSPTRVCALFRPVASRDADDAALGDHYAATAALRRVQLA